MSLLIKGLNVANWTNLSRCFHTASVLRSNVDKALLSKLRKKTGFTFINCKQALAKFDNDFKQAEKWLREQAKAEGWAKATKLQGRAMSQGLVALMQDSNMISMVEVNCETDFVARNMKFVDLVKKVTSTCLEEGKSRGKEKISWDREEMKLLPSSGEQPLLGDSVALNIGSLGENIAMKRAVFVAAGNDTKLGYYVHGAGPTVPSDKDCHLGKYAAVVAFSQSQLREEIGGTSGGQTEPTAQNIADVGRQLAQHVVGMNPKSVGNMQEFEEANKSEDEEEAEVNGSDSSSESDTSSSDSESDSDADDEIKETKTSGSKAGSEDETRMIFQDLLTDPEIKVGEFLLSHNVAVDDFLRFECGEVIDEE